MELQGPDPDAALADLYDLLVRGLGAAIGGHRGGVEANFGDFAQEALIKITGNLDSFRGESRFTTWAQKIYVSSVGARYRDNDQCRHGIDASLQPTQTRRVRLAL
jgi:DNA-directed RNA polymerase specialized sigma24 family protein